MGKAMHGCILVCERERKREEISPEVEKTSKEKPGDSGRKWGGFVCQSMIKKCSLPTKKTSKIQRKDFSKRL